jgi:hypothetical protein
LFYDYQADPKKPHCLQAQGSEQMTLSPMKWEAYTHYSTDDDGGSREGQRMALFAWRCPPYVIVRQRGAGGLFLLRGTSDGVGIGTHSLEQAQAAAEADRAAKANAELDSARLTKLPARLFVRFSTEDQVIYPCFSSDVDAVAYVPEAIKLDPERLMQWAAEVLMNAPPAELQKAEEALFDCLILSVKKDLCFVAALRALARGK